MKQEIVLKKRSRILYIDGECLYAQIGGCMARSSDFGENWECLPVRFRAGVWSYSRLHARLGRIGVHSATMLNDGTMLAVAKRALYRFNPERGTAERTFRVKKGSRPLCIANDRKGGIFWGEYFHNPKRDEVNIYGSCDEGRTWSVVYTFARGSIRHVHGVFCDPYDGTIWVTTGDDDRESALWKTAAGFKRLEKVTTGGQQARALQLIFTETHVYFGTDTPFEKNHLFRIAKDTGAKEKLCSVEGSVYWGCKAGGWIFFSTAVEPSAVNTCGKANIWGSPDGIAWRCCLGFAKDHWPIKYFQIGQVLFPGGENRTPYLFFTPFATDDDQTVGRIHIDALPQGEE